MRVIRILIALLVLSAFARGFAAESERVSVRGILFIASEEAGEPDRRLGAYERHLRQNVPRRFNSVRHAGEGRTQINVPGEGSISLGQGQTIGIEVLDANGDDIRVRVTWRQGRREILNIGARIPFVFVDSVTNEKGEVYGILVVGS